MKTINFHKQSGLSLIELMIAALLGIILMAGVTQLFISSKLSYNLTENMSRAQESGRFAIDVLARYARVAGYSDINSEEVPDPFMDDATLCGVDPCTQEGTGNFDSDQIAIQSVMPGNEDCNGVAGTANNAITNVFWVQDDANGISTLYCRGYNNATSAWLGTEQPYISGVDSMQALYGLDDGTGNITNFVNSTRVTDWSLVRAIKIAVLSQAAQAVDADFDDRSYVLLDNEPLEFTDGQPRYVFSTTIYVTNTGI